VFTLRTTEENDESEKSRLVDSLRTARLFGEEITIQKLSSLLSQGWEVKTTSLSQEYLMEDFTESHTAKNTLMLFAVDPKGRLRPYTDTSKPEPSANWLLIYLSATANKAGEAG
jgi:CPA1 family monovalent cation:H+ antiporter